MSQSTKGPARERKRTRRVTRKSSKRGSQVCNGGEPEVHEVLSVEKDKKVHGNPKARKEKSPGKSDQQETNFWDLLLPRNAHKGAASFLFSLWNTKKYSIHLKSLCAVNGPIKICGNKRGRSVDTLE